MRHVRTTICAAEKQRILHNLGVYFVAVSIQHAMCMRHIVACPAVQHLHTLPHIRHEFRTKKKKKE
jgi:hypothetical protein